MIDDLPFPRWAYVPGRGRESDRVTLECAKVLVPARFDRAVPHDHPVLLYGLALNDAGFFWECHEILEAVWKAAPPNGGDKILLRALIQIANANLKRIMGQPSAVARLFAEAMAELTELAVRHSDCDGIAAFYPAAALTAVLRVRMADTAIAAPVMIQMHSFT